jgi:glycosyltransferase involved in cell wall biosynthesis
MRLSELPPPPPGKDGWPWTEASSRFPDRMPGGQEWPRLSVVTPSYGQGAFLEATIRSVLLQGYPNLEYVVIDGGSTDESVEIIRRYERWLAGWVSEPDRGLSDAINKGFARSTGEILGWLNSDDVYEPNALGHVARHFRANPTCALLYGGGWEVDEDGRKIAHCDWIRPFDRRLFLTWNFILQPAAFWRRSLWEQVGELSISHDWAMDWEWLIRATAVVEPHYLPIDLASWRVRPEIKTRSGGWPRRAEIAAISRRYGGFWQPTNLVYLLDRAAWLVEERLGPGISLRAFQRLVAPLRWVLKERVWKGRYQGGSYRA